MLPWNCPISSLADKISSTKTSPWIFGEFARPVNLPSKVTFPDKEIWLLSLGRKLKPNRLTNSFVCWILVVSNLVTKSMFLFIKEMFPEVFIFVASLLIIAFSSKTLFLFNLATRFPVRGIFKLSVVKVSKLAVSSPDRELMLVSNQDKSTLAFNFPVKE